MHQLVGRTFKSDEKPVSPDIEFFDMLYLLKFKKFADACMDHRKKLIQAREQEKQSKMMSAAKALD
jgi:hypothetical protein